MDKTNKKIWSRKEMAEPVTLHEKMIKLEKNHHKSKWLLIRFKIGLSKNPRETFSNITTKGFLYSKLPNVLQLKVIYNLT